MKLTLYFHHLPELKRKIASLDFDKQRKILQTIEIFEK